MKKQDIFYEQLDHTYDSLQGYYTKIILGDLNAQIGRENAYKQTAGNRSLHTRTVTITVSG